MSLTDEQIDSKVDSHFMKLNNLTPYQWRSFARAIESATAAPLLERIRRLVSAIDEEMVVSHLGVFNEGDDPAAAIKKLMLWSQGLGEYFAKERIAELEQQLEAARKDAERLDWVERKLFVKSWNGVIDSGSRTHWRIAGDYRHTTQEMAGHEFRAAVDAAISKEQA